MLRNTAMPTYNPVNAMPNPTLLAISAAVEADPHSRDILLFLLKKPNAMDSAKGIASWWVHGDEVAVQSSLNRLSACAIYSIVSHLGAGSNGRLKNSPDSVQDPSGGCQPASPRNRGNSATQIGPTRISQPV